MTCNDLVQIKSVSTIKRLLNLTTVIGVTTFPVIHILFTSALTELQAKSIAQLENGFRRSRVNFPTYMFPVARIRRYTDIRAYLTGGQIGRSLVRFQMASLEFFIDIILPIALWLWGRLSL